MKVLLRLLTPNKEEKLQALLASAPTRPAVPLDPANTLAIARTILHYPLALLLTTHRILYQAYFLHYDKKLLVYPRPEPKVEGDEKEWNPPEVDQDNIGVAVGWQQQGWAESKAEEKVVAWAKERVATTGIDFEITCPDRRSGSKMKSGGVGMRKMVFTTEARKSTPTIAQDWDDVEVPHSPIGLDIFLCGEGRRRGNDHTSGDEKRTLAITTSDPKLFTNLLLAPTARHFVVVAPELVTSISSPELFEHFFAPSRYPPGGIDSYTAAMRQKYVRWFWTQSLVPPTPDLVSTNSNPIFANLAWAGLVIVIFSYFADVAEESIMNALGAKFVIGREPWKLWERALERQYQVAERGKEDENGEKEWKVRTPEMEGGDDWVDLESIRYDG